MAFELGQRERAVGDCMLLIRWALSSGFTHTQSHEVNAINKRSVTKHLEDPIVSSSLEAMKTMGVVGGGSSGPISEL